MKKFPKILQQYIFHAYYSSFDLNIYCNWGETNTFFNAFMGKTALSHLL